MLSLMQISEDASGLVLSYPLWIGVTFMVLAVAAVAYAVAARRRAWPLIAAALIASWAAVYFTTFSEKISHEVGTVYGFLRYDHAVRWKDAADVYLERRGGDWKIVVRDRDNRAYDFDVSELGVEGRQRVMTYMVDLMPASAFHRDTAVLRREAEGPRPVGFSSDEQI